MAYKGRIPAQNNDLIWHHVPSRTNLHGRVQIIPEDQEIKMKIYDKVPDALSYIADICAQKKYDSITFQNHTRLGHDKHVKITSAYINKLIK